MSMSLVRTKYKQVQRLEQIKNNCPKDLIWLIQSCALGDYKLPNLSRREIIHTRLKIHP